ncbi:MAG: protein-glutamate O-methyltransferase CheR [Bacteroidales bacterium]|jgi:chemotaxis methyl-accepting protein methylase
MTGEVKIVSELLFVSHGMDVSKFDDSFLRKSLNKRMSALEIDSFGDYCLNIQTNKSEADAFFDSLNINFSEFFRNPITFAYLEQIIFPALIEKKRQNKQKEIRIWSAACAAGQEALSMAIIFDEILEASRENISCRIFATDINKEELENARKGVFMSSCLSKTTLRRIHSYFTQKGDNYTISPKLYQYLEFSVFDLLTDKGSCPPTSIYGNFDLVFCSNLLFYYKPEYRRVILEKAGYCLAPGGYLITGDSEREILKDHNYKEVFLNSGIFRKP